ncbi:hypothetical protein ACLK2B_09095 [Escherichia coli]
MTQLTLGLDRDSGLIAHLFRRTQRGGQGVVVDGHPGCAQGGQVCRHLRSGPLGSS